MVGCGTMVDNCNKGLVWLLLAMVVSHPSSHGYFSPSGRVELRSIDWKMLMFHERCKHLAAGMLFHAVWPNKTTSQMEEKHGTGTANYCS